MVVKPLFKAVMSVHVEYDVYLYNLISMMIIELFQQQFALWPIGVDRGSERGQSRDYENNSRDGHY
jgi:hypothetical protein